MRLKLAKKEDLQDVYPLVEELFEDSVYSIYSDIKKEDTLALGEGIVSGPPEDAIIILLCDDDTPVGILAASVVTQLYNRGEKTGVELAFWIKKDYRSKKNYKMILGAYKFWCRRVGCSTYMLGKLREKNKPEEYIIKRINRV